MRSIFMFFVSVLLFTGCSLEPSTSVVKTVPIDEKYELAVYEYNYNAIVEYVYRYFVVEKGQKTPPANEHALLSTEVYKKTWVAYDDFKIKISCVNGEIFNYRSKVSIGKNNRTIIAVLDQSC